MTPDMMGDKNQDAAEMMLLNNYYNNRREN